MTFFLFYLKKIRFKSLCTAKFCCFDRVSDLKSSPHTSGYIMCKNGTCLRNLTKICPTMIRLPDIRSMTWCDMKRLRWKVKQGCLKKLHLCVLCMEFVFSSSLKLMCFFLTQGGSKAFIRLRSFLYTGSLRISAYSLGVDLVWR